MLVYPSGLLPIAELAVVFAPPPLLLLVGIEPHCPSAVMRLGSSSQALLALVRMLAAPVAVEP
jgi:hypothetical protein